NSELFNKINKFHQKFILPLLQHNKLEKDNFPLFEKRIIFPKNIQLLKKKGISSSSEKNIFLFNKEEKEEDNHKIELNKLIEKQLEEESFKHIEQRLSIISNIESLN